VDHGRSAQTSGGTLLAHFTGSSWTLVDSNGSDNFLVQGIALGARASTVWNRRDERTHGRFPKHLHRKEWCDPVRADDQ